MSKIALTPNASGTGIFTIASPNSNSNRTLSLPDETGTVITSASTSVVTPAMLTQPLTSGTAVASTSGTSIDFTSLPAWVKRITVMFNAVSTNSTSLRQIQIGSGSVSTSGYASAANYGISAGQNTGTVTTGFILEPSGGATAANLISGPVVLTLVSSNTWVAQGAIYQSSIGFSIPSAGISPALGGALDRVRITTVNGTDTFDAGSINILYE